MVFQGPPLQIWFCSRERTLLMRPTQTEKMRCLNELPPPTLWETYLFAKANMVYVNFSYTENPNVFRMPTRFARSPPYTEQNYYLSKAKLVYASSPANKRDVLATANIVYASNKYFELSQFLHMQFLVNANKCMKCCEQGGCDFFQLSHGSGVMQL